MDIKFDRKKLVTLVENLTNAYEDFPFNRRGYTKIIFSVMRHHRNNKTVAIIFEMDNKLFINLKLTPVHIEETRRIKGVFPGYHMNKTHWNMVEVNNTDLSYDELIKMIKESNKLTS